MWIIFILTLFYGGYTSAWKQEVLDIFFRGFQRDLGIQDTHIMTALRVGYEISTYRGKFTMY